MEESYSETRFITSEEVRWPPEFVIVSAYATAGEHWTDRQNAQADQALWRFLKKKGGWLERVICTSRSAGVKEPCWAFQMPFEITCELGMTYRQEAFFYIKDDELFVSYCDERRALRSIGRFRQRVDSPKT